MNLFMFNITLAMILSFLILAVAKTLSLHSTLDREKTSPFECGFDPKNSARIPFSTRFFLLAVVFLVFDIEIALLMPIPIALHFTLSPIMVLSTTLFFLILLIGLFHEWNEGSLDWTN